MDRLSALVWPDGEGGTRLRRTDGVVPPGAERYVAVPHVDDPRFLLPLDTPAVARARLLRRYNHLRTDTRRILRLGLAAGVRVGLPPQRAGRNLLHAEPPTHGRTLLETVAEALGVDEALVLSTGIRPGSRVTLNVTDSTGEARAFVKVVADADDRAALLREHAFLADFAARAVPGLLVPRPLFLLEWGASLVLGVDPLPDDVRRVSPRHAARTHPWLEAMTAARPRNTLPLDESPWLADLARDAERLPAEWAAVRTEVEAATERWAANALPHGVRHGDWSPWNMAWTGAATLALWDWEFGHRMAPLGLDRWNWRYTYETSVRGFPADRAAGRLRAAAALARSQEPDAPLLAELFLLDMLVRRAGQAAAGNDASAGHARALLAQRPTTTEAERTETT
ncbi:phosphotransferase [Nocardioides pacificus]